MLASMAAVACNVAFSSLAWSRLGAPGLALGTTLAALVNFTVLRVSFARLLGPAAARRRPAGLVPLRRLAGRWPRPCWPA